VATIPGVRAAWLVALVAFVVLALGASPAWFWLDSGELAAAGYDLGVAHPPGGPGLLLLLRLATLVPLGSLGFRMGLVSCALGAAAVGLVVAVLRRRGANAGLASIAGLWVLAGLTFVRQGRVVEVYALGAALFMVVVWGLDPVVGEARRTGQRLVAVAAATWAAWCFGDLRLAFAPLLLVLWIRAFRAREPWARWAPVVVAWASLVILALPLASVGAPELDWGDPDTLGAMIDQLTARSIREAYADEILPASGAAWALHARGVVARLAEDLGAPGLAVAGVCLVAVFRRDPREDAATTRGTALAVAWLVLVALVYAVGINPMGGADRQTGLPLALLAALVVGDAARRWLRDRGRLRWGVLPLLATMLLLPPTLHGGPDVVVTRSWAPHAWTRAALAQLPPGSLLLTQSDDLAAGVAAARLLEGARPDVIAVPAQHLYRPTPEAAAAVPSRAAIWEAAHAAEGEAGRIEAAIAAHAGPVALESPRAGVLAGVRWWSEHGRLPLAIAWPGAPRGPGISPADEIARWRPRLPSTEDRRRLAVALANWARASVQQGGSIAEAGAALERSLREVDDRHPSAYVTWAALRDRAGDHAGAIALTRRALELEPGRHAALTNLALYLSRDPATRGEALEVAEAAVALRPWKADGWARLAEVRAIVGDVEGAARARARAEAERASRTR
jgi:tetratricopeptide (TPR) repeat protein